MLSAASIDDYNAAEDICSSTDGENPVTQQLSPPDIVASSIKERPKDLPGVKAVKIGWF